MEMVISSAPKHDPHCLRWGRGDQVCLTPPIVSTSRTQFNGVKIRDGSFCFLNLVATIKSVLFSKSREDIPRDHTLTLSLLTMQSPKLSKIDTEENRKTNSSKVMLNSLPINGHTLGFSANRLKS